MFSSARNCMLIADGDKLTALAALAKVLRSATATSVFKIRASLMRLRLHGMPSAEQRPFGGKEPNENRRARDMTGRQPDVREP